MQFIERLFGISPDSGSGLLELSLVAIVMSIVVVPVLLKYSVRTGINHNGGRRR
jgi:hypothetical protein